MENKNYFVSADILLPNEDIDLKRYSVIACDQYTSQPEYWHYISAYVGDEPSVLNLILPEVYLKNDNSEVAEQINENMKEYEEDILVEYTNTFIYVERVLPSNGKVRNGIVGCIDLEDYSYEKGVRSAIRATEGTVLSRIPPRVEIRSGAMLEFPHVMLFCDDKENKIFSALEESKAALKKAYSFELMRNSGKIEGYFVDGENAQKLLENINEYAEGREIVFAVGDGNHSLATAKACYEKLKDTLGEDAKNSPARYALCELVNIHDEAIEFEPIYRTVKLDDPEKLFSYIRENSNADFEDENASGFKYTYVLNGEKGSFVIKDPASALPVGEIQKLLDEFLKENPDAEIDYIHGVESLYSLCNDCKTVGFLFEGMQKDELFSSVLADGALPRKTFSMGSADDKRFYLEGRRIK